MFIFLKMTSLGVALGIVVKSPQLPRPSRGSEDLQRIARPALRGERPNKPTKQNTIIASSLYNSLDQN